MRVKPAPEQHPLPASLGDGAGPVSGTKPRPFACRVREEAVWIGAAYPPSTLDRNLAAQLSIDFQTGRPTAINSGNSCADQRAACVAINRERTRGILEAAQFAPPGESLPVDVWDAAFARSSYQQWDVPLIPLEKLGIHHDEDGLRSSDLPGAHTLRAEANPSEPRDLTPV